VTTPSVLFLGTIAGGVTSEFVGSVDSALHVSLPILIVAGLLLFSRGKEKREAMLST
jgi:hypothetical protein